MHHLVAGERGAERHRHLGAAAADHRRVPRHAADAGRLHVLGGEHGQHLFGRARRLGFDRQHAGMGVRRAHEGGIGLVRQPRVVREAAIAAHQGVVLDARLVFAAGRAVVMGDPDNVACAGSFIADRSGRGQGLASAASLRHSGAPSRRRHAQFFRGRNEQSANHRYPHPHPDPGNRRPAEQGRAQGSGDHHARRRGVGGAGRGRCALPAVPDRRLRHRAPPARHGCGGRRCARALGHAADLSLQSGRRR